LDCTDVMRTTAAVRLFRDEPVTDHVLFRVLDAARFAASGANLQGRHVSVVHNQRFRRALKELYGPLEQEYMRAHLRGDVAFSPGWVPPPRTGRTSPGRSSAAVATKYHPSG
jgi:nitroreductase